MGDSLPRADAHEDRIAVMLPIPADVAATWPDLGDSSEPHVTMVYVGGADETALDTITAIVADEASAIIGETIALGAPDYFVGPKGRAVFARVTVPEVVRAARDRIALRIADAGIDVGHIPLDARMDAVTDHGPWVPHATLAYMAPGEGWTGETPTGEWAIDNVQVWHGDARHNIGGPERSDKISNVDGKWQVLTEDGTKVLGEFETEDEARERLREIESAKAAKQDDAPRSDQAQIELFRPMIAGIVGEILGRAPAVHTESRLCEWVMRSDQATVLTPDIKGPDGLWRQDAGLLPPETLANGWRRYPILYSKAGNVQTYVFGGQEVLEWRDPAAVFDRAAMDTGIGIPWELRHSPELLTPDTVRGVARGVVMTVDKHTDGIHTAGHAIAWDRGLWTAIDTDAPEVSVANRVKIDPRPGTTDDGKPFDRRQVGFIMNSLASEPRGNAGTARVLTANDRLDAAQVVHRADDLLQIGRGLGRDPTATPVYYDLRGWVRHDSATPPTAPEPEPRKDIDTMNDIIKALLEALTPAEIAEKLKMDEADVVAALAEPVADAEDPPAADDEEKPPEDAPPREDAETVPAAIDGKEYMVAPDLAAAIAVLLAKSEMLGERADRLEVELKTAKTEVKTGKAAAADMVPRADAAQMAADQAMETGAVIALAQRVHPPGEDDAPWAPEPRQDAEGKVIPPTLADWQHGVLRGVLGADAADAKIARIDAAPEAARATIMSMAIDEAREVAGGLVADRANKTGEVREGIRVLRDENANNKPQPGPIAAAKQAQRDAGLKTYSGARAPAGA